MAYDLVIHSLLQLQPNVHRTLLNLADYKSQPGSRCRWQSNFNVNSLVLPYTRTDNFTDMSIKTIKLNKFVPKVGLARQSPEPFRLPAYTETHLLSVQLSGNRVYGHTVIHFMAKWLNILNCILFLSTHYSSIDLYTRSSCKITPVLAGKKRHTKTLCQTNRKTSMFGFVEDFWGARDLFEWIGNWTTTRDGIRKSDGWVPNTD